jgi:hypothetical protein
MKYQKQLEAVQSGNMSRADLVKLKQNAERILKNGDQEAAIILEAINNAAPTDAYYLFMGFCPGATFDERLDIEWKEQGICRFDFLSSSQQLERFTTICKGDQVILKKREKFGESMKLYGHGRVASVAYDENDIRYLKMDWSNQDEIIEVPLLGCNSTVDIRSVEVVERDMPETFFSWLEH